MIYDWVIIGAGFEGSHLAFSLAKAGKSVCLVKRDPKLVDYSMDLILENLSVTMELKILIFGQIT